MDTQRFRVLTPRLRALVAISVLLDGMEAGRYLEGDSVQGRALERAATDLAKQPPEVRMPLVGTLLRIALRELKERR